MVSLKNIVAFCAVACAVLLKDGASAQSCSANSASVYTKPLGNATVSKFCQSICPGALCVETLCACTASSSNSTTPTKAVAQRVPKGPMVVSYWDMLANVPGVEFEKIPMENKLVLLAFSVLVNGIPNDPMAGIPGLPEKIKARQAKGGLVYLSLGGAANCINPDGTGDGMFGASATGKEKAFADKVAQLVEKYDLDGVDIDYECVDKVGGVLKQNKDNALAFTKALREKLPNLSISWTAFSDANMDYSPNLYADHVTTYRAIIPYVDIVLWMAYNIGDNAAFYTNIQSEFDQLFVKVPTLTPDRVAVGICADKGCAYGAATGPLPKHLDGFIAVGKKSLGLMIWDIKNDYLGANKNWDNTFGVKAGKAFGSK